MTIDTKIWTGPGRPAVFLDRDGTINEEVKYLSSPHQLRLIPGAAEAIARLNQAGIPVIVVTNQSGIARGYYTEDDVEQVHSYLDKLLADHGASIDAYYYCPHHPGAIVKQYLVDCECRKPRTGMLSAAAAQENVSLAQAYLVGDKRSDLRAAISAGARGILVRTGYGKETEQELLREAEASGAALVTNIVDDLAAAVDQILTTLSQSQPQGIKPPKFAASFRHHRPEIGRHYPHS
ncbi:D-glycero-beta-D-manno-heptose 1,7-bisphosphate 7-phosphatase [Blastopirellula marina]|uniref:D,D-heptose 1,7-bisphosphate phosphatase n=1 Tax=Blastopirellula marina TaxID=124 RepID=A0A2S8FHC5_9BACT|nr:D-glycero-beta-D-manno-heptose 1,7-bisphosphate 7-phosphatase [Blastopirellula marina]PQO31532.1 D-glycero-beta-D-manno-heptose-1,7-bisphosphate 7-phosphatase [Blastopirellula marina]PTL42838.1 D-glycero-beta-D-manno-heptose-1,7-bisphosphate 7-phosphatase [Blastopirellula marina]